MLDVTPRIRIPLEELKFSFSRSGGPGGQNVNKVNTKVTLRWDVQRSPSLPDPVRQRLLARYRRRTTQHGELLITSQRYRDQGRNVADCMEKLRDIVRSVASPPVPRRPTRPTRASKERRLGEKKQRSKTKKLRRDVES
jgi:ribosome-associated protein